MSDVVSNGADNVQLSSVVWLEAPRRAVLLTAFSYRRNFLEGGVWWRLVGAEVSLV
jgi:hypothetical protein